MGTIPIITPKFYSSFKETDINTHIYGRITDGLTTDNPDVFKDLADSISEDENENDAININICRMGQVPN